MNHLRSIVWAASVAVALCAASPGVLLAQTELSRADESDVPVFHYDIVKQVLPIDAASALINIFVKIPYDELQFTITDLGYVAKYEVTAVVYNENGDQVDGTIWQKEVTVNDYEATNSRNDFSYSHTSFAVTPGKYELSIGLTDLDSRSTATQKESIEIPDYDAADVSMSDISYARFAARDSLNAVDITPEVTDATMGISRELYAYFEVYTDSKIESVRVAYDIYNPRRKKVYSDAYYLLTPQFRTPDFFQIDVDSLYHGRHILHVKVSTGELFAETEKMFNIRWVGLPTTVTDLELAIEQLRYIARKDEYNKLRKAKDEEKLEEFKQFWQRRDPTPGTDANEAADEHYRRVQYSNDNFTVFREGWKTDMGLVYIILGPPSEVSRNPYPIEGKPYEIWFYYKFNRDFIFYDERGFGEYRLVSTYSIEELLRLRE